MNQVIFIFQKIIIKLHTIVLSMCIQPKSFLFSFVFLFCASGSIPKAFRFINGILHSAARPIKKPKIKKSPTRNHPTFFNHLGFDSRPAKFKCQICYIYNVLEKSIEKQVADKKRQRLVTSMRYRYLGLTS